MARTFPAGFLWGSSTAAHQIEGGNWNSDWWEWEHKPGTPCVEPSGDACDFLHLYEADIAMLAEMGHNAFRFSLEWARIEPEEGEFSNAALNYYARVIDACERRGVAPVVTLHHFTGPRWFAHRGGWERDDSPQLFARYVARVIRTLGERLSWVGTLNEPNIVALAGWLSPNFPPGKQDPRLRHRVNANLVAAHLAAVEEIKAGPGKAKVGLCLSMTAYEAVDGGEERLAHIRHPMHDVYLEAVRDDASDWIGVQTYTRTLVGPEGVRRPPPGTELTQMGYEFYPRALGATVREAYAATGKPVLVTENGIGTEDDSRRIVYIDEALGALHEAISDGVPCLGYLHWSLLDNFEWNSGYRPKFGLVAVDRETFVRTPKPSAAHYSAIIRRNGLP
jgi:beta-glucosidase